MNNILNLLLESVYFMLPAYAANSLPVIINRLNLFTFLAIPVDFNKNLFGKPIFGHSKTLRGFIVGIAGALIIGILQYFAYSFEIIKSITLIEYSLINAAFAGFLLGSGALLGDLFKSFLKRRIGISSGKPWILFDQIDYPVGALLMVSLIFIPSLTHITFIIIVSALLSIASNIIAYLSGIKKVWW